MERFEREGLLASRKVGVTREYVFNPRYLFLTEVEALLEKALTNLPDEYRRRYLRAR